MAINQDNACQDALNRANGYRASASRPGGAYQGTMFQAQLDQNAFLAQVQPYHTPQPFYGPQTMAETHGHQAHIQFIPQPHGGIIRTITAPADITANEQYNVYPEQVLADNPGEAMEAAFAAYDEEFEEQMQGWMGAHGPQDRVVADQVIDHVMSDLIAKDMAHDAEHGQRDGYRIGKTQLGPSLNPNVPGSNIETLEAELKKQKTGDHNKDGHMYEDREMKKHAESILGTLGAEGSALTKEKLAKSSFCGLMKAIATGQAVVQGETFVDSFTGKVIEDWSALANGEGTTTTTTFPTTRPEGEEEGKGKGKMITMDDMAELVATPFYPSA